MSLRLGDKIISGISRETKLNAHSLLDFKWTDHILNEMSWIRADTFSWQSGDVYTSVYNLLVSEFNNGTEETEGSITFKRSPNGYKITTDESSVSALFNETGVAWYYILDLENRRFKLPRTKYGFTGLRDSVGNYVPESLPNIKGRFGGGRNGYDPQGAFAKGTTYAGGFANLQEQSLEYDFDASRSSSAYKDNAPVQQCATQMYLYFYVGEFSQTATEQTAGLNAELFNSKADTTLSNINASVSAKEMIVGWGIPNYSAGIVATNTYKAPKNGWIYITKASQANPNASTLKIFNENGTQVASLVLFSRIYNTTTAEGTGAHLRAIKNYTYTTTEGTCYINFYPDKE